MAVVDRTAVVSLIKELSDDSILQEVRSCQDEELLLFFLFFFLGRGRAMSTLRSTSNVLN